MLGPMLDQFFYLGKKSSVHLEEMIISTIGISENKKSITAPTNLREILMFEKEKELVKNCFPVIDKMNIVQDNFFCTITATW